MRIEGTAVAAAGLWLLQLATACEIMGMPSW